MPRTLEARYAALLDEIEAEFPGFRLVRKDRSFVQRSIHQALSVITLGAQRRFLSDYVTTLGQRVYVPPTWDQWPAEQRIYVMRHERVHLRQFARYGIVPMAVAYLLLPLPMGLSWCRMRLEREAYEESIRAAVELWGRGHVEDPEYRRALVRRFTGGDYAWMWPFPRSVERWLDATLASAAAPRRT